MSEITPDTSALQRILAREGEVRAFAHLDVATLIAATVTAEQDRSRPVPKRAHLSPAPASGRLAGLTAGIKDVIETADAPTALGSVHYRGRQTGRDAAVVSALRAAGATIVGKTTTAEFAYRDAPQTRNPLDPSRTPGGSSSGSAAAVAAGMVDFALGTQTGGSMIRPAAYCGVVGFKPTHGLVSTAGVMHLAPSFDTVGVMARDVATVARVAEVIAGLAPMGPANPGYTGRRNHIAPDEPHIRGYGDGSDAGPRIGVLPAAELDRCEPEMLAALSHAGELLTAAGAELTEIELPVAMDRLRELHAVINAYEGARSLAAEADHCRPQSAGLIDRGLALSVGDYTEAVADLERLRPLIDRTLGEVDVMLTPASLGPPPVGLTHTGGADYCQPWSAARVPAVTIPLYPSPDDLPLGMQLVAPRWADAELLGWAAWVADAFIAA